MNVKSNCQGYLVHVVDTMMGQQLELQNVPIVQEFLTVFLEHLIGLPPDYEIEFLIEVILGTAPISKAPYRMAPAELKELETQLQELIDKGFICPSHSS